MNRSIDIRSMRGVRHAVRGFLARNRGNVPSRIRYPTLSLIIDLGISLVPSVDHPNDRARGERIDISGITTRLIGITGTWTHVPNSGLIRVTDKECHAPVRWINTSAMKATREREKERDRLPGAAYFLSHNQIFYFYYSKIINFSRNILFINCFKIIFYSYIRYL